MTGPLKRLRAARGPASVLVALALALAIIVFGVYWYRTAPNAGLAVVDDGTGVNLCYAAVHAERIVVSGPVARDVSAHASDCIRWPNIRAHDATAKFAVEVTGSFGRRKTIVSDDLVAAAPTVAAAPSPPAVLPSRPPSTVAVPTAHPASNPETSDAIAGPVLTYYADWNDRRFAAMWQLLSPAFRSNTTYAAWLALHTFNTSIAVKSIRHVGPSRVAVIVVAAQMDSGGKDVRTTYNVTWNLVFVNGHWLLDSAT